MLPGEGFASDPLFHRDYIIADDTAALQPALRRVGERMGLERAQPGGYLQLKESFEVNYRLRLEWEPVDFMGASELAFQGVNLNYFSNNIYRAEVRMEHAGDGARDPVLSHFMLFALAQEMPESHSTVPPPVTGLPLKSESLFWKTNWYSQGKAAAYALRDNPYTANSRMPVWFGYAMDALSVTLVAGGAALGEGVGGKVTLSSLGLVNSFLWKYFYNGKAVRGRMVLYNRIASSGYDAPRESPSTEAIQTVDSYPKD